MQDDKELSLEDALDHAVWARNMEVGKTGQSPFQIMIGKTTAIPGITEGNEVTDGKVSDSEMVKLHFERQRKARLLHLQADSENRIKQGIQARTSQYQDIVYKQGDEVLY